MHMMGPCSTLDRRAYQRPWALGWIGLWLLPGVKLVSVPTVTYPKSPDMCTSTSRMWLLQLETATLGLPEGSLSKRRLTEIEHFFMCLLAICMYVFFGEMFKAFAHFLLGCLFFWL